MKNTRWGIPTFLLGIFLAAGGGLLLTSSLKMAGWKETSARVISSRQLGDAGSPDEYGERISRPVYELTVAWTTPGGETTAVLPGSFVPPGHNLTLLYNPRNHAECVAVTRGSDLVRNITGGLLLLTGLALVLSLFRRT
jgi:hypothetical protein